MQKQKNIENDDEFEDYYHSEDLAYFKFNDEKEKFESKNIFVNISMTLNVTCRICKKKFLFNNALHKHFRDECN